MDWLSDIVGWLNTALWTWLMTPLLLGAGVYFTIRLRFLQIRGFGHMLHVMRRSTTAALHCRRDSWIEASTECAG